MIMTIMPIDHDNLVSLGHIGPPQWETVALLGVVGRPLGFPPHQLGPNGSHWVPTQGVSASVTCLAVISTIRSPLLPFYKH